MEPALITDGAKAISSTGEWGVIPVTIFFVMLLLVVVGFFAWILVSRILKVVEENTTSARSLKDMIKSIEVANTINSNALADILKTVEYIKDKQGVIHDDIKEIRRKGGV